MVTPTPGRRLRAEDGSVVLSVTGILAVITLFLLASLSMVTNATAPSRRDGDAKAALAAAQAGIEDYLTRLEADDNYWARGNDGDPGNPAFTSAGRVIPGTGGKGARYRYRLVSSPVTTAREGSVRLQVTGSSGPAADRQVERTLLATLRPKGFLQFVYFSDVDADDPVHLYSTTKIVYNGQKFYLGDSRYRFVDTGPGLWHACGQYYESSPGVGRISPSFEVTAATPVRILDTATGNLVGPTFTTGKADGFTCKRMRWGTGDVLEGPFHSNDAILLSGSPLFTDPMTESSWRYPRDPTRRWWVVAGETGEPSPGTASTPGFAPVYADPLPLPASNSALASYVTPNVVDPSSPGPGCRYVGATRITFQGTTMRVHSPSTTDAPSRCLDVAVRSVEQVKAIPPVIYVAPSTDAANGTCTTGQVGYPIPGEWLDGVTTDYDCHRGTVYVSGTVDGQVTVSGVDDVVVVGDLTVDDGGAGSDVIGLVAGSYVWVHHPVDAGPAHENLAPASAPRRIDAAILALRHCFVVQNASLGSALSTGPEQERLRVTGSISQKFRCPVGADVNGVTVHGYKKHYLYDTRLRYLQPPFFLQPTSAPWLLSSVADRDRS